MDCSEYNELISRLMDNDLSGEENEQLQLHLESCAECRALYETLKSVSLTLQEDMAPVPEGFAGRVMKKAASQKLQKPKKNKKYIPENWRFGNIGIWVACAALVIVSVSVLQTPPRTAESYQALYASESDSFTEAAVAEEGTAMLTAADIAPAEESMAEAAAANEMALGSAAEEPGTDLLPADILADGGETRELSAGESPDYCCDIAGESYEFYCLDGALYWCPAGSDTLTLSPLGPEALESLKNAQ